MSALFSPVVLASFVLMILFRFLLRSIFAELGSKGVDQDGPRPHRLTGPTALPLVTRNGQVLTTVEELDDRLEMLKDELRHKEEKLATSETEIREAERELRRMRRESRRLARQYSKLDVDVKDASVDCMELRREIGEYVERKGRARREFDEGFKYYKRMLQDESLKDFEVVREEEAERGPKTTRGEIAELMYKIL